MLMLNSYPDIGMGKQFPAIAEVISVCSSKDIDAWAVAAKHIVQFIDARSYLVVVPDKEVGLFSSVTCAPYKVMPESYYVGNAKEKISQTLDGDNQHRVGWYLQQFVKIAAVLGHDDKDTVLIWDADTVPLKKLDFVGSAGRLSYYKGEECRRSYFDFIERALGLKRTQTFSFIAQSLVTKVIWARELFESLSQSTQKSWMDAILLHLNPTDPAGFAEFETLGTWIWHHHRDQIVITDKPWYRNGLSLVGNPTTISKSVWAALAKSYDFISFEAWDMRPGFRNKLKMMLRRWSYGLIGFLRPNP